MPPVMDIKYQDPGETKDYPFDWIVPLQQDDGTIDSARLDDRGAELHRHQRDGVAGWR